MEAHKEDGGHYKLSTLVAAQHNLQREFQKICNDVDLICGEVFRRANVIFDAQLMQLKKLFLGKAHEAMATGIKAMNPKYTKKARYMRSFFNYI